ncbi:hypothetical protein IX39_20540 [Chryseobacterium formosense]|uniref:Uncharacterized protein n=1 Tax=Chryseobacterium formosense TaxID=236814 RepID=A0A085YYK3_9FLAO|nr:hypothetical protein [Chryseobacterium formosense]KFE97266.1 hypothetical protein IX39_20540 [Chryseobacterium formosense]SFT64436.1 hypothetical protein SAMN05421857_2397 [Chryseobacterium formosense]
MKKYITLAIIPAAFLFSGNAKAQIAIGKTTMTNDSVLLEFGSEAKGIILPAVNTAPGAVNGTFVLDNTTKSVRVMQNGTWTDLSTAGQATANPYANAGADTIPGINGVVMGAATSSKPGVLVLESTIKALVLPKVSEANLNIPSPVAGTMVYDTQTSMLAVYDGANWNYWK